MQSGKVKSSIFDRSIRKQLHKVKLKDSPFAREAAENFYVVEGWTLAAERVVYRCKSVLAAAGMSSGVLSLQVLLPRTAEEKELKALMGHIRQLCEMEELRIASADARVLPTISDLILMVYVTSANSSVNPAGSKDKFYDLVVAGEVAAEGTSLLAISRQKELLTRYPADFIQRAQCMYEESAAVMRAALKCADSAQYICPIGEGGIFAGFWELAAAARVGLEVSLKSIPIRQHTIEICEFFQRNPYMLCSGGSLLIAAKNGAGIVQHFQEEGIAAGIVGRTNDGNDRIVRYDDEIRYLEPPKSDEIYSVL